MSGITVRRTVVGMEKVEEDQGWQKQLQPETEDRLQQTNVSEFVRA